MKEMSSKEQKQAMLGALRFLDEKCRKNKIEYSLIGGSLIGAIRHKGFIPWDDDVDVILTKKNYEKLRRILNEETGRYQALKYGEGGECYSFIKLIDTHTQILEGAQKTINPHYGVFVDIFCYYPTSDDYRKRKRQYGKIKLLMSLIERRRLDLRGASLKSNVLRFGKNIISKLIGYKGIKRAFDKTMNKYGDSKYVVSNWPVYGFEKEIQLRKNVEEYIDARFEDLTVMVFKNYDDILTTTYGDYMKLPPKSERTPRHNIKVWWKEDCCE